MTTIDELEKKEVSYIIDLVTILEAILMSRQPCEKLSLCLYENLI